MRSHPPSAAREPAALSDETAAGRLSALLEASPDAIIVIDAEARILSFNGAAERMFGFEAAQILGQDVAVLMPADQAAHHGEHVARYARTGVARMTEQPRQLVARRRDGTEFPMELSIGRVAGEGAPAFIGIVRDVTVRQHTLASLTAAESRLRNAQSQARLGSFETCLPDEEPRYWSEEMYRILGLPRSTPIPSMAEFARQHVHPEDRENLSRAMLQASHGESPGVRTAYRVVRSDGRIRHVETTLETNAPDAGGRMRLAGTMQDVTERTRIEDALRMERDRAQRYLDLVDVVIVALDAEGRITLMNRRGCELLGYREIELLGQDFFANCLPARDTDAAWLAHQAAMRGELDDFQLRELQIVTRAGEERRVRWRTQFIRDPDGSVVGTLSAGEDVTDQRRMEEQLRRAEEELRLTFQHAPIGMATLALSQPHQQGLEPGWGRFLSANQALCAMLGHSESALLERTLGDLLDPEDAAATEVILRDLMKGRTDSAVIDKAFTSRTGDRIPATSRFSIVLDRRGRPLMLIAQILDRTDILRAEAEARQQRERLAHVARLGAMGEMAAGIAHELNQPLAAIATYTRAVQRLLDAGEMEADELADVLSRVAGQAQRAGQVIKRLRQFVRRGTIERGRHDVNQLISEILTLAEPGARDHGVRFELDLADGLASVQVDGVQLQQVILNLIRNAIDAVAAAHRDTAELQLTTRPAPDDEIVISVSDTGDGVPEETVGRLFEPFFTTKEEGMGLGLPLSRSIVEAHGGRLEYRPRPGGGSIFSIHLPTAPESRS